MKLNEQLTSQIAEETVIAYQNASLLGLFKSVDISDIGVDKWFHKNLSDIPDAALTLAGFNPSQAKLDAQLFSHTVMTAAESLTMSEQEVAQFNKYGLDSDGIALLGQKVAEVANNYLFLGQDMDGNTPTGEANFFEATGAGTLESPGIITAALTGVWGTYANKITDCYTIIGSLLSAGFTAETSIVLYPKSAYASMHLKAADEMSAIELLQSQGVLGVIAVDDQYLYTDAGALPTNALFDLYAIDMNKVEIGYSRAERTQVIGPHDVVRATVVECEVWFVPYLVPVPKGGAIKKGVSRITAIAQS